jgi:hypothetical protein
MHIPWHRAAQQFIARMHDGATGGCRSVPGGPVTLYGTCYGLLAQTYLGDTFELAPATRRFIQEGQDPQSGWFVGPELQGFQAPQGALHDREHLRLHLTCAALPVCSQFNIPVLNPLTAALRFCDIGYLRGWLQARDLRHAWFEGNNLLFAGQLLVHLRDAGGCPQARPALDAWFEWLEEAIDPATSLWGSNGLCSQAEAVYGGYHQLLVYYHEQRPIRNPEGLIDVVLNLQHADGGFHPEGNAGACEDVDCVDILVNLYKLTGARQREIRLALRKCLFHILAQQNPDGGFPYTRNRAQSHMGVPGTGAPANVSTMFPTWFRIHTLALMSEILTDEPQLKDVPFRFSDELSMGWHRTWDRTHHAVGPLDAWRDRMALGAWKWGRIPSRARSGWGSAIERIKVPLRKVRRIARA